MPNLKEDIGNVRMLGPDVKDLFLPLEELCNSSGRLYYSAQFLEKKSVRVLLFKHTSKLHGSGDRDSKNMIIDSNGVIGDFASQRPILELHLSSHEFDTK